MVSIQLLRAFGQEKVLGVPLDRQTLLRQQSLAASEGHPSESLRSEFGLFVYRCSLGVSVIFLLGVELSSGLCGPEI